ncbi:glutamate formimidoyltransferase [Youngiibacter multivorans]|uniref:glutamate formimidoyltransferase n=1 Tax=Youngiibacter multivorans TaxID=937251 RepID=A0ABS4G3X7_9CLOT|nr:glutamate formimidoyltransferase [Youngiibacter multivorans]MBP1919254.1 glutamate formiminotransferase [Youngiibacter multivorans]
MDRIVECVPNYSTGRDPGLLERIAGCFRGKEGVKLLDYTSDVDHNRSVVTVVGEPLSIKKAVLESVKVALDSIDMRQHTGAHPRMGAVDVIPFIPIKGVSVEEAIALSREVGQAVGELGIPVYLYEKSATRPDRENLANIRKGQFEGLKEKMAKEGWESDFGPKSPHETFGAVVIGARMPLVAFNVNLGTSDIKVADEIARKVRHIGGGLRFVKAMGVSLTERKQVQVSMNLTDFSKTSIYSALENVRFEARRYGVSVVGTEIVGLVPLKALSDSLEYYMGLENFSADQILETRLME